MTELELEARAALAAKGDVERQLASAAECPPWRHLVFAGLMAALVAAPVLDMMWRFVAFAFILGAIALVVRSDRRRMGMFINGYRRGKTLYVTLPMLAINLALYVASFHLAREVGEAWPSLALAGAAFLVSLIGSILWQRVFRSELGV